MVDVHVLNQNLDLVAIIDAYKSLIWASRYWDIGDCELYLAASPENLAFLKIGFYLARPDNAMVCRIKRIEIDTNAEDGNYLIINGEDTKSYLDQRIIWGTATCKGKAETFIRSQVTKALINASLSIRNLIRPNGTKLLKLGALANLPDVASEQMTYKNIGEKVREYCRSFGWGYQMVLDSSGSTPYLAFGIYKGVDRANSVLFSPEYENLASTKYVLDKTNIGNVALCAGEGEGAKRTKSTAGYAESTGRFEIYVDAKDISKEITWEELTDTYPGGTLEASGAAYNYKVASVDIQILSADQRAWLVLHYPSGQVVTVDGVEYYRIGNAVLATVPDANPDTATPVTIKDLIYIPYLLNRGLDALAEFGTVETFEGSVIPDATFVYGRDYNLGDIVTVRNEYGIEQAARIVEIVEVMDENGYNIEPKFENITR